MKYQYNVLENIAQRKRNCRNYFNVSLFALTRKQEKDINWGIFLFVTMKQILTKILSMFNLKMAIFTNYWNELSRWMFSISDIDNILDGCHLKIEWGRFSRNNSYYPTFYDNLPYFCSSFLLVCLQWKNHVEEGI